MLRGGPLQLEARPPEFRIQAGDRVQRFLEEMLALPAEGAIISSKSLHSVSCLIAEFRLPGLPAAFSEGGCNVPDPVYHVLYLFFTV